MPNTSTGVCVIIVNWNGRFLLPACLESVGAQTLAPDEIIVVDNGSQDGSIEYLEAAWHSRITLLRNSCNMGFTAGVNAGIRHSSSRWIAVLNNDAVADRHWLEELIQSVEGRSDVGMCAGKILLADPPGHIDKTGHLIYWDGLNGGRGFGERDQGQYDEPGEILFPDGCAALYRRQLFEQVGLFDEDFFAYGDDAELGLRARLYGWLCLYVPSAVVFHHHSSTLGRSSPQKAFLVERNRIWLAVKLFPAHLLLLNPIFSFWRYFWHAWSAISGKGSAGTFVGRHSFWRLAGVLLRANLAAIRGMGGMLRKRQQIALHKRLSSVKFVNLIREFNISASELALRNR